MDESPVTVRRYFFLDQAYLARSLLESVGIPCFLANEQIATAHPGMLVAAGGIRLQVPAALASQAIQVLDDAEAEPGRETPLPGDEPADDTCPACGSAEVIDRGYPAAVTVFGWLLLGAPFLVIPRRFECATCGHCWRGF